MSDRPARVTPEQEAAWRCPRCGSSQSVGYGMWPNSGPLKAQCVPCGTVSDWPKIKTDERPMFDRLDRNEYIFRDKGLEEAVRSAIIQMDKMTDDYLRDYLTARGLILATPERDAAVAAKALREAADDVYASSGEGQWPKPSVIAYLRDRADRIEREAGESNADT